MWSYLGGVIVSKRRKIEPFEWWVYIDNFNSRQIEKYNVLKYMAEDIKKMKKKSVDKGAFAEQLKQRLMWQYWSRAEYELVIYVVDNRVYLKPWCGCSDDNLRRIDVTDDTILDWQEFAEYHIDKHIYKDAAKIDIWDQIEFRWNEFVDYCWTYRHKYERVKKLEESTVACLPNDTIAKGMIKYLNEHLPPVSNQIMNDTIKLDTTLVSTKTIEDEYKEQELIHRAENWLNNRGIETRGTEECLLKQSWKILLDFGKYLEEHTDVK